MSTKGSIEIGVKTIVMLVVAVIVIGLAIGFVVSVFRKASMTPELVDTSVLGVQPTSNDPVVMFPQNVKVAAGGSKKIMVGVYNTGTTASLMPAGRFIQCKSTASPTPIDIEFSTLCTTVAGGTGAAFQTILTARPLGGAGTLANGEYVCMLQPVVTTASCGPTAGSYVATGAPLSFRLSVS